MSQTMTASQSQATVERIMSTEWLDKPRLCKHCNIVFEQRYNLGQHQCAMHPRASSPRDANGGYACCGRRYGAPGCCPTDHVEVLFGGALAAVRKSPYCNHEKRNRLTLTDAQVNLLGDTPAECERFINPNTWRRDHEAAVWHIDRIHFGRYRAARNDLCRHPHVPRVYERDAYRPLGDG